MVEGGRVGVGALCSTRGVVHQMGVGRSAERVRSQMAIDGETGAALWMSEGCWVRVGDL